MSDEPDAAVAAGDDLARAQKRLLKRLYNGRTIPVVVEGRAFLTYRDATRYLLSLGPVAREAAYLAMKAQGRGERH
jgi:hypothetical protein